MISNTASIARPHPSFGINPHTNEVTPEVRAQALGDLKKFREKRSANERLLQSQGPRVQLPATSAEEFGLGRVIGQGTFFAPKTPQEIAALMKQIEHDKTIVMSIPLSAMYLDMVHPGSTDLAQHLHPGQAGLTSTTRSLEDLKRVRFVWKYCAPKKGETHPESIKLTDGGLFAAWLVKDEPAAAAKAFQAYEARCQDLLTGNEKALAARGFRRVLNGLSYRFKSYGIGTKEGLAGPRHNGVIASNLLVTGLTLSSALYMLFYGLDYAITIAKMPKKPKHADTSLNAAQAAIGS